MEEKHANCHYSVGSANPALHTHRPSEGSVQGTFSGFDEDKYKVLEVDGHCLTHKVSKAVDSNVAQVVVFTADEAGRSPAFDVIMVEEKHKWWRTTFE